MTDRGDEDPGALTDRGFALLGCEPGDAEKLFRRALATDSARTAALMGLGFSLVALGKFREAITPLRQVLAVHPEDTRVRSSLAWALSQTGQEEEAVEHLGKILKVQPGRLDTRYGRVKLLKDLGRYPEALAEAEEVLRRNPAFALARCAAADLCGRLNRWQESENLWSEAAEDSPEDPNAHHGVGFARLQLGCPEEAIPPLERAQALAPEDPTIHFTLGRALHRLGRHPEAFLHLELAAAALPSSASTWTELAISRMDAGDLGESEKAFHRAIQLDPQNADLFMFLSVLYAKLDRMDESVTMVDRAEALRPGTLAGTLKDLEGTGSVGSAKPGNPKLCQPVIGLHKSPAQGPGPQVPPPPASAPDEWQLPGDSPFVFLRSQEPFPVSPEWAIPPKTPLPVLRETLQVILGRGGVRLTDFVETLPDFLRTYPECPYNRLYWEVIKAVHGRSGKP